MNGIKPYNGTPELAGAHACVIRCEKKIDTLQKRHQDEKRQRQIKKIKERIAYHKDKVWELKGQLASIKQT